MVVELQVLTDIYSEPNSKGVRKLLGKNLVINKLFDINEIEVEEFISSRTGKAVKKYSGIFHKENYYKVNKPYSELRTLKMNKTYPVLGFMGHSKYGK